MIQLSTLQAEFIKLKYSTILGVTFLAFGLAPLMGGVFVLLVQDAEALEKASGLAAKARLIHFEANWKSYLDILNQAVGVGGVLVFGFVASWLFGREYSDGTAKDLLALPTSRTSILNAKFSLYILWCLALAVSNLLLGLVIGLLLQLPEPVSGDVSQFLLDYFTTTGLTILVGVPIAFFAIWGKGYLAPLGFVALTLVFAQVIAATGYGSYFPWSIPGLYSGAGGEYKDLLDVYSYSILVVVALLGYLSAVLYWTKADQTK
ncbi:ABC transporter permease [Telluribacter humicola]|uniref:ABC transporter permease n=1 Tax=Telluribacter humicola TaxID=1720261 RepID=UPI001A97B038|nr:ABC transporter permease [Telluribacter humicola]